MAPPLLYPFRYLDPLTGGWVRALDAAERHEIAERYAEWEITGPRNPVPDQARELYPSTAI